LFGNLLLGTLDKFKKEIAPTAQVQKLSEIDKRLEKTREEDRERVFQQKQEMFAKRREDEIEYKKQRRQKAIEYNVRFTSLTLNPRF
jgi:HPt (histidine-containing phosphotransfer) domain-containing protein